MTPIPFYKMSGSGNDFIVIDNRDGKVNPTDMSEFAAKVCRRAMSVGADGLILVEDAADSDFRWRFYNSDGSVAEMCGNGARCMARFAYLNGIADTDMTFETDAGVVSAAVDGDRVRIGMTEPFDLETAYNLPVSGQSMTVSSVNTGVPHVVVFVQDIEEVDVFETGREIRYHERYQPAGTNVNFVCPVAEGRLAIRTYERGVEDETLACGTGAVAGAVVASALKGWTSPVSMITRSGGTLNIHFGFGEGRFADVVLEGDARIVYKGELAQEAWDY